MAGAENGGGEHFSDHDDVGGSGGDGEGRQGGRGGGAAGDGGGDGDIDIGMTVRKFATWT